MSLLWAAVAVFFGVPIAAVVLFAAGCWVLVFAQLWIELARMVVEVVGRGRAR